MGEINREAKETLAQLQNPPSNMATESKDDTKYFNIHDSRNGNSYLGGQSQSGTQNITGGTNRTTTRGGQP